MCFGMIRLAPRRLFDEPCRTLDIADLVISAADEKRVVGVFVGPFRDRPMTVAASLASPLPSRASNLRSKASMISSSVSANRGPGCTCQLPRRIHRADGYRPRPRSAWPLDKFRPGQSPGGSSRSPHSSPLRAQRRNRADCTLPEIVGRSPGLVGPRHLLRVCLPAGRDPNRDRGEPKTDP